MRTFVIVITALLAATLLAATPATAQSGSGDSPRKGLWDIPKDQRAEAQDMISGFKAELQALNAQIQEKMERMDSQFETSSLNESRIRSLAAEIMGLRSEVYKKTVEFRIEFHKKFGVLPF